MIIYLGKLVGCPLNGQHLKVCAVIWEMLAFKYFGIMILGQFGAC